MSLGVALSGCFSLGPRTLKADQVDYARALGDAKKREILAMIVGLRYADAPAFLTVSQVIDGYTFTASASPVANSLPDPGGPAAGVTGIALTQTTPPSRSLRPRARATPRRIYTPCLPR